MIGARWILMVGFALVACFNANAAVFRIATWNLGWHVSTQELPAWLSQCSRMYAKDAQGIWRLAAPSTPQAKRGWDIAENRATLEGVDLSRMPPCAAYTTSTFAGIEVTTNSYFKRQAQLAQILAQGVRPDVIAFQEVSGTQAAIEALGPASTGYNVCSFDGQYKVQRLAFAWKKTLGASIQACTDIKSVSLPSLAPDKQVRPAYVVTLTLAGKKVRFMTVHLKSGCVSPLEGDLLDGNTGPNDPCPILQQQVAPLEEVFEQLMTGVDHFVVLGDFNRNLWHEWHRVTGAEPVRSDGEVDLTKARTSGVRTRNMLLEINDGTPSASKAVLMAATCAGAQDVRTACEASKTAKLTSEQRKVLTAATGLGCRNPIGLDQVLVSESLLQNVRSTEKVSIGQLGGSLPARPPQYADPVLAVSDHCPVVMVLEL